MYRILHAIALGFFAVAMAHADPPTQIVVDVGQREGAKRQHPRTGLEIGFLGCYFNDAGVNPMHDEFFAPMSTEAPAILKAAMQEGPDLAVSLHSHEAAPTLLRPAYVPDDPPL